MDSVRWRMMPGVWGTNQQVEVNMKWMIPVLALVVPFTLSGQEPAAPETPEAAPAPAAGPGAADETSEDSLLGGSDTILNSMQAIQDYLAKQSAAEEEPSGEPMLLTARGCVELALSQNAQVLVAQDDLEAAQARIGQARSQMKPQLKGSMTFTHTEFNTRDITSQLGGAGGLGGIGGASGFGGGGGFGLGGGSLGGGGLLGQRPVLNFLRSKLIGDFGGDSFSLQGEDDFRTDKFELNQVLYAGGQIRAAINASKYLAESQEWKKEATLAQLEYQAKQAFYDTAASQALVRVAEASVKSFERNLADAQQMFDVGMVSSFEVLRAQTEVGSRKANLVEARNAQRLAQTNLRRIIAVPQDTFIQLDAKLDWLPYIPEKQELLDYAGDHRPEIQVLQKAINAAEADIDRVRGQYKPQVGGNIQWQNVDKGGYVQPDGWTFSVGGQLDIYAGGKRKHEKAEAKAQLQSLEDQLTDLQALVELDITQASIQIKDSMARIVSENGTLKLAQEGLRLAELRFQEGVGTQSETLDAELALTDARRSLVQALRDLAVANAALERAIGKSWTKPEDESAPLSKPIPGTEAAEEEATPAMP